MISGKKYLEECDHVCNLKKMFWLVPRKRYNFTEQVTEKMSNIEKCHKMNTVI